MAKKKKSLKVTVNKEKTGKTSSPVLPSKPRVNAFGEYVYGDDDFYDNYYGYSYSDYYGGGSYYGGGYSYYGGNYSTGLSTNKWDRYGSAGGSLLQNYGRYYNYKDLKSTRDILRKGISKVKELITVLNIKKKVFIRVNKSDESSMSGDYTGVCVTPDKTEGCYNSEWATLFLQTKILEDENKSTEDKINTITAEGVHECAHLLFTHNRTLDNFISYIPKLLLKMYSGKLIKDERKREYIKLLASEYDNENEVTACCYPSLFQRELLKLKEETQGRIPEIHTTNTSINNNNRDTEVTKSLRSFQSLCTLVKIIANLLEDYRVNSSLSAERPGITDHLKYLRDWETEQIKLDGLFKPVYEDIANKIVIDTLNLIRGVKEADNDKLEEIKAIISRAPKSTLECCKQALKVLEVLEGWFQEDLLSPIIYTIDDKVPENESLSQLDGMLLTGSDTNESYNDDENGDDDMELPSPEIEVSKNRITRNINRRVCKDFDDEEAAALINGELNDYIFEEGEGETFDDSSVFYYKITSTPDVYSTDKMREKVSDVSNYASVLKKSITSKFKNRRFKMYGCKSGTLDPTKIVEAYQGVESVYTQPAGYETQKVVLTLLIDESGSMGDTDSWCVGLVKSAAALLVSAFGCSENIDLYIYGHSADLQRTGSTDIFIYKEGSKKTDRFNVDIEKLSFVRGRCENRDGYAIYAVAKRVNELAYGGEMGAKGKKSIMVVLSDGQPWADNYHYGKGVRDTREKVTKAQKDFGTDIIQCTVKSVERSEDMFDTVIKLEDDLTNFTQRLSNEMNKLLEKKIEVKKVRY
jgi:hypothetical protein